MRHIPSTRTLNDRFWVAQVNRYGFDKARSIVTVLRNLFVAWKEGRVSSRDMLEEANQVLKGHGVEHLRSINGKAEAYYVNRGETYALTVLLDTSKDRIELMPWGDWVEKEERRGNKFD